MWLKRKEVVHVVIILCNCVYSDSNIGSSGHRWAPNTHHTYSYSYLGYNCSLTQGEDVRVLNVLLGNIQKKTGISDIVALYDTLHEKMILLNTNRITIPLEEFHIGTGEPNNIREILDMSCCEPGMKPKLYMVICGVKCFFQILQEANTHELNSSEQGYLTYRHYWLLVANQDAHLMDVLTPKVLNVNNILLAVRNPFNASYQFYTAIWGEKGRQFIQIQCMSHHEGPLIETCDMFPNTKYHLNGRHFNVSTNLWISFVEEVPGYPHYRGISMELLKVLAYRMNFTYTLSLPPDGKWGGFEADGSWNGLIGQLERKEVDMVVAPLSRNWQREQVMDATLAYSRVYYSAVYRTSQPDKLSLFVHPLRWEVYTSLLAASFILTFLLVLVEKCLPPKKSQQHPHLHSYVLMCTCGACVLQAVPYNPSNYSSRLLISFWWVLCIIIMNTYTGNLIAVLTVDKPRVPFRTLNDLANADNYKVGTQGATISTVVLQQSRSGVYARIWDRIETLYGSDPEVLNPDNMVHVRKVKEENYAYITDLAETTKLMAEDCNLQSIEERFHPTDYTASLQDNSVYTEMVSQIILELRDTGLLKRWHNMFTPKVRCGKQDVKKGHTLTIGDIQGAFIALAVCLILSFGLLLSEVMFYHYRMKKVVFNSENVTCQGENMQGGQSNNVRSPVRQSRGK